ncbi:MAG TPA: hypothetical protein PLB02_04105 [Thermoanaerobaculia bacterium]|nr:hypothetical protein [Thermoanaerobaculia bacterium]HQR66555.1 hypothetical protein [Thermoanaerobaculia bacterium]
MTLLVIVLSLSLSFVAAAADKANVQVLKAVPAKPGCQITPDLTYRSERDIGRPFEKLCRIESSESALLSLVDLTGKAVEKARKLACTCGADALLIAYNSSDVTPPTVKAFTSDGVTTVKAKRKSEDVIAFGIKFIEPPKPRPNPLKDGFRDLTWGQPVPEGFTPQPDPASTLKVFVRSSDSMKLGPVEAKRIEYRFLDGTKFMSVTLSFAGGDRDSVRSFLESMWGPADLAKDETVAWERSGEATAAVLGLVKDPLTLVIFSKELEAENVRRTKGKAAADAGL